MFGVRAKLWQGSKWAQPLLLPFSQAELSFSYKQMLSKYLKNEVLKGAKYWTAGLDNTFQSSLAHLLLFLLSVCLALSVFLYLPPFSQLLENSISEISQRLFSLPRKQFPSFAFVLWSAMDTTPGSGGQRQLYGWQVQLKIDFSITLKGRLWDYKEVLKKTNDGIWVFVLMDCKPLNDWDCVSSLYLCPLEVSKIRHPKMYLLGMQIIFKK